MSETIQAGQYVYGRLPAFGINEIARSEELPFFNAAYMQSLRYGRAPDVGDPERIWTQQYELFAGKVGGAVACLYPLKQTETPCAEQKAPYLRGITPAAHYVTLGEDDFCALLKHPEQLLYFDGFFPIDEIYHLPTRLEKRAFTPPEMPPPVLEGDMLDMALNMLPYVWRAFAARGGGDTIALARARVFCVIPSGTPSEELARARALASWLLSALPMPVRHAAFLTINTDTGNDSPPSGSMLYIMHRSSGETVDRHEGIVFDPAMNKMPAITPEERAYFLDRIERKQLVDDVLDTLNDGAALDLSLRVELFALQNQSDVRAFEEGARKTLERIKDPEEKTRFACMFAEMWMERTPAPGFEDLKAVWHLYYAGRVSAVPEAACLWLENARDTEIVRMALRDQNGSEADEFADLDEPLCIRAARVMEDEHIELDASEMAALTRLFGTRCGALMKSARGMLICAALKDKPEVASGLLGGAYALSASPYLDSLGDSVSMLPEPERFRLFMRAARELHDKPRLTKFETALLEGLQAGNVGEFSENDIGVLLDRAEALKLLSAPILPLIVSLEKAIEQPTPSYVKRLFTLNSIVTNKLPDDELRPLYSALLENNFIELGNRFAQYPNVLSFQREWYNCMGDYPMMHVDNNQWNQLAYRAAESLIPLSLHDLTAVLKSKDLNSIHERVRTPYRLSAMKRVMAQLKQSELLSLSGYELELLGDVIRKDDSIKVLHGGWIVVLDTRSEVCDPNLTWRNYNALWLNKRLRDYSMLNPEQQSTLKQLIKRDAPRSLAGCLICAAQSDGSINWNAAMPACIRANGGVRDDLQQLRGWKSSDYEVLLDILSCFFGDTPMLGDAQMEQLGLWLKAIPRLVRWLEGEHRRNGDLFPNLISYLGRSGRM